MVNWLDLLVLCVSISQRKKDKIVLLENDLRLYFICHYLSERRFYDATFHWNAPIEIRAVSHAISIHSLGWVIQENWYLIAYSMALTNKNFPRLSQIVEVYCY